MDSTYHSVCLAAQVRRAAQLISAVGESPLFVQRSDLAAQALQCDLALAELYDELIKPARKPVIAPRREQFDCGEQLPF